MGKQADCSDPQEVSDPPTGGNRKHSAGSNLV